MPSTGIEPTFSTTDAEKLGVKEQVGTFTTHHPCCAARVHNIHTIADIVNGAVIMPGATFSLNQFVGPRDTKRGFVEAPMIEDGLFQKLGRRWRFAIRDHDVQRGVLRRPQGH